MEEEADDYFVLVLSDANLHQYNINTSTIRNGNATDNLAINLNTNVNTHIIFIGNIGDQAERLVGDMNGNAFLCLDVQSLPKVIKSILLYSIER